MTDTELNEAPEQVRATTSSNYWSEGAENLKGTLSSLSLTGLGKRKTTAETNNDVEDEAPPPKGGYWEWQETIKKTLSTVSLGNLAKKTHGDADSEPVAEPKKNYWFWRQSFKSKSDLNDGVEGEEGGEEEEVNTPPAGSSYWFWRNSSASLNKAAGGDEDSSDGEAKKSGPISNLEHKLRSTWRKSFQHLSSNSLTKLDEGEASNPTGWKDNFRSFRESFHNLKVSGSSSKIDEDGATAAASSSDLVESAGDIGMDDSSQDGISF